MKNIGYISAYFLPMNNAGAVRGSFFVDKIISEGNNVTIFTSTKNNKYKIIKNSAALPTNKDSNVKRLIKEILYGIELFFRILFSKKMDLYILSTPPFFITIFAILAVKLKNSKNIVLDVRDIYPEVFFENQILSRKSLIGFIFKKIEFFMYKNSRVIFTVTKGLQDLIVSTGIERKKVIIVKNGYDSSLFKLNENKYNFFTVVFHGTLSRFQNIELLVKLIEKFEKLDSTIKFLVIGNGSKDYLLKNKRMNNLTYLENVDYAKIPTFISKCHLGLSLRTDDNISQTAFPVKIFEYIGVGLPILVTPKSEAGIVVAQENIGIESTNNIDELVKYIYEIKDNYNKFVKNLHIKRNTFSRQSETEIFYKNIQLVLVD